MTEPHWITLIKIITAITSIVLGLYAIAVGLAWIEFGSSMDEGFGFLILVPAFCMIAFGLTEIIDIIKKRNQFTGEQTTETLKELKQLVSLNGLKALLVSVTMVLSLMIGLHMCCAAYIAHHMNAPASTVLLLAAGGSILIGFGIASLDNRDRLFTWALKHKKAYHE